MDIIFQGEHSSEEAAESFLSVLRLFKDRYHIEHFREMHLHVSLVDQQGNDIELVDSETAQVYRTFEVYHKEELAPAQRSSSAPKLKLVIDNTHKN